MSNIEVTSAEPELATRRGWRRVIVFTFVGLFLVAVGSWAGWHGIMRYRAQQELDQAIAQVSRTEKSWRIDELEAARKPLEDDKNAALVVMAIKEQLPLDWQPGVQTPLPQHQLKPDQLRDLKAAMAAVKEPLAKATALADYEEGRYPSPDLNDGLAASKHCEDAPAIATILRVKALVQSQENKPDEAMESALAIAGAARSIGDEPRQVAQMARMRCRNELLLCVERILAQGEPSEDMLIKCQHALATEESAPSAVLAARGERAGYHQLALAAEAGDIEMSKVLLRISHSRNLVQDYLFGPFAGSPARKAHARMLELLTELVESTKLPPEEQGAAMTELTSHWTMVVGDYILFPELDKRVGGFPGTFLRNRASLRLAIAAVAAERFRRANKHWPEKLDDLVLGQSHDLPTDAYVGGPIQFERRKDGITIFSPGKDKADGDVPAPARSTTRLEFRLWNVDQRRQLPPDKDPPERGP